MYGQMSLRGLIARLEAMPQDLIVKDGFGDPHSDRGCYDELAFTPEPEARIGDMLAHAKSALGATFRGYKGGDFTMEGYTSVYIGHWGECGEEITSTHFKYWELTAQLAAIRGKVKDHAADLRQTAKVLEKWQDPMAGPFDATISELRKAADELEALCAGDGG